MPDALIQTAMKRWRVAQDAQSHYRPDQLDDLKFSTGDQWPADVSNERALANRPCLTVDQTGPYIRQITNDQRQNRPTLKITAEGDSTEKDAEIWEGICRHILADSDADIAFDTATDSQVRGGEGYFRILTEYCDDDSFDQDIKIKRIKNPFTVSFDPGAMEPDYSDAKWCFITSDVLKEDFKADYPDSEAFTAELADKGNTPPEWMGSDYIRIAEYFVITEVPAKLYMISDGQQAQIVRDIDTKQLPEGWAVLKERDTTDRKVKWYKITAFETLEEKEWAGKYIPVVPVLGEDYDVDGKRVLRGLVRSMKDPARMYNYWTSAATEAIALAPKAPWIIAFGQIKGFEKYWETANTKSWSYLPYNPIAGAQAPIRNQFEPPVGAMSQAIQQAANDLSRVTGIFKDGLGAPTNADSGKAIIARQREGDVATFHYQDNLARAIKHLGRILLDLIPKIYDTARVLRILHEDGSAKTQKVNQLDGIDLSKGKYNVAVNVGPSYTTKRQEAAESMTRIVQADPSMMEKAGDIIVHNMDFAGHTQLADRLKLFLPPQVQQAEQGQDDPAADRQKVTHLSQMVNALSQQLHKLMDEKQGKTLELQSRERISSDDNLTKIRVAAINNESNANLAFAQHLLDQAEAMNSTGQQMAVAEHAQSITPPPPQPV